MNNDFTTTAVRGIVCLVLSAIGIYFIVSPLQETMQERAQDKMNSNTIGPMDDAIADLAGVPRRPQTRFTIPNAPPVNPNFNFNLGNDD